MGAASAALRRARAMSRGIFPASIPLYARATHAARYAEERNTIGMEFDAYGRSLGRRLLLRGDPLGERYVLNPVAITRYFEFAFAAGCLPRRLESALDLSSPRLFSLYVAEQHPSCRVHMLNPDSGDSGETSVIVSRLGLGNVLIDVADAAELNREDAAHDCVWSISVLEHVSGDYTDGDVMRWMYGALGPGGRLILTVPVDRTCWDEYRDTDTYGLDAPRTQEDRYFFQRFYDREAIWDRLLRPIGIDAPDAVRWFGETSPGRFHEYIRRWLAEGLECTVDDPREIADHYREYASWDEMPGVGVCGLMLSRPA